MSGLNVRLAKLQDYSNHEVRKYKGNAYPGNEQPPSTLRQLAMHAVLTPVDAWGLQTLQRKSSGVHSSRTTHHVFVSCILTIRRKIQPALCSVQGHEVLSTGMVFGSLCGKTPWVRNDSVHCSLTFHENIVGVSLVCESMRRCAT
jgi:hypothetical protein